MKTAFQTFVFSLILTLGLFASLILIAPANVQVAAHSQSIAARTIVIGQQPALEVLSPDLVDGAQRWQTDVSARWPGALIIAVHGGIHTATGEWYAYPLFGPPLPMALLIAVNRIYYPHRHIVLISCNPGHTRLLGVHNITYALNDVWVWPDDSVGLAAVVRDFQFPEYAGRLARFVTER